MKQNPILRALFATVLLSLIFSIFCVMTSAEKKGDYSYPSSPTVNTLYADEFLESYIPGISLTDAEKAFLRTQSGFFISYNSAIPGYAVKTEYEDGTLTVTAKEYTYTAVNGTEVVWTPISATLNGTTKKFAQAPYTVSFSGVAESDSAKVEVKYSTEFKVDAEEVNRLVNLAYSEAPRLEEDIKSKREAYEKASAEYTVNSALYAEYISSLALYNAYISEKRIYDEKYAEYEKYVSDLTEYNEAVKAYNEYIIARDKYYLDLAEYTKYLAYAEQNSAKILAYEKYSENFAKLQIQLGIIKATKTEITSLKRTVYSAIIGDTVTTVIDRKGDVVQVLHADEKVVDMAGVATENLRVLLKEFFKIPEDDVQAQYQYYVTNYEAFRDNFVNLLVALDSLYLTPGVRGAMIAEEKHEKYLILVAQLYHVANALSDEPIKSYDGSYFFDSNYLIGMTYSEDKRTSVSEALENEEFIADSDSAAPLADGYPIEPEVPEYRAMEEPILPTPVTMPVKPEPVSEPQPPVEVAKPETVENPGKEPKEPEFPEEAFGIIEEYNDGKIQKRQDYSGGDISVSPKITVTKAIFGAETVTVTYYDKEYLSEEKQEILYRVSVNKGEAVDYLGEIPAKLEDSEFIYTHIGWTDSAGGSVDLSSVNSDMDIYPAFSALKKEYETKWVVDGTEYLDNPGIPPLPDGEVYYDFSGWEKTTDSLTGNVTYTALYDKPLVPLSNGAAKVTFKDGNYHVEPSVMQNKFDVSALIDRAVGVGGINIRTLRGEELYVSYSEIIKMHDLGVHFVEFSSTESSEGYAYVINLYDENGEAVSSDTKVNFKSFCEVSDVSHFVMYYNGVDGAKNLIRYEFSEGTLSFSAASGKTYYAKVEYSLTPVPLDAIEITLNKTLAGAGEQIFVSLRYGRGIRIDRVYIMDSLGKKTTVTGSGFKMPSDDITVGVDYTVEQYTVTFVSEGKTIVRYLCSYGDTVSPPPAPNKASNEKYSYEFIGWSPKVSTVDGNATYTALYSAIPIPEVDDDNMEISRGVLKLLLLGFVGLGCFLFIVVPSVTMSCIMVSRRKKLIVNSKKQNK